MRTTPACTEADVWAAIRAGNFYSTTGPDFLGIEVTDDQVSIETSPIRRALLVGPPYLTHCRQGETPFTNASFPLDPEWRYVRLVIEDDAGRRAWTNTLFVPDNGNHP